MNGSVDAVAEAVVVAVETLEEDAVVVESTLTEIDNLKRSDISGLQISSCSVCFDVCFSSLCFMCSQLIYISYVVITCNY